MKGLTPVELMADATAQGQMEDGLAKARTSLEKAKNRAKSLYAQRVLQDMKLQLLRCEKLSRRWDKYIQDAL
jgi:hypothetical protein